MKRINDAWDNYVKELEEIASQAQEKAQKARGMNGKRYDMGRNVYTKEEASDTQMRISNLEEPANNHVYQKVSKFLKFLRDNRDFPKSGFLSNYFVDKIADMKDRILDRSMSQSEYEHLESISITQLYKEMKPKAVMEDEESTRELIKHHNALFGKRSA
tara:strand:+ start:108 stop:584 length:477 start_codon:yes stop_codon:yes gene_type:complete